MSVALIFLAVLFYWEGTDRHNMYIDDDTLALQIAAGVAVFAFFAWVVETIANAIRERGQR